MVNTICLWGFRDVLLPVACQDESGNWRVATMGLPEVKYIYTYEQLFKVLESL